MAYIPYGKGRTRYYITVRTRDGAWRHLATGTRDKATAAAMEALWKILGPAGKRRWDLLQPVLDGVCTLSRLYDHYVEETLDQLTAELEDVDLAPGVEQWDAQLEEQYRGESPRKMRHWILPLFPRLDDGAGRAAPGRYAPASRAKVLAPGFLAERLAAVRGSRTNRRRHHEAWTSCFEYLKDHGLMKSNPMRDVKKPKPDRSTTPHLDEIADVLRLVERFPAGMHQAAAALREGAGMEIQAVLAMRRRDVVDVEHRIVWAHGSKNEWRDRQVAVDAELWPTFWAWVERLDAEGATPDTPLFPASGDAHRRWHGKACRAARKAGVPVPAGYGPHAARHTYAIRHMRANDEPILIANNLGHADASEVIRLYGKYRPKIIDIRRVGQRREED